MSRANCSVDDAACKVAYDRVAFPDLNKSDFQFAIVDFNGDLDRGEFQMLQRGVQVRYHHTEPFPKGALKYKGKDVNSVSCVIKLKKKQAVDLNDYFNN